MYCKHILKYISKPTFCSFLLIQGGSSLLLDEDVLALNRDV